MTSETDQPQQGQRDPSDEPSVEVQPPEYTGTPIRTPDGIVVEWLEKAEGQALDELRPGMTTDEVMQTHAYRQIVLDHIRQDIAKGWRLTYPQGRDLLQEYDVLVESLRQAQRQVTDLEEVLEDKRRLARDLDVILNGEVGAAEHPNLGDLLTQVDQRVAENEALRQHVDPDVVRWVKRIVALEREHNQLRQQATIDGERLAYQEGDIADLRQQVADLQRDFDEAQESSRGFQELAVKHGVLKTYYEQLRAQLRAHGLLEPTPEAASGPRSP